MTRDGLIEKQGRLSYYDATMIWIMYNIHSMEKYCTYLSHTHIDKQVFIIEGMIQFLMEPSSETHNPTELPLVAAQLPENLYLISSGAWPREEQPMTDEVGNHRSQGNGDWRCKCL